MQAFIAAAVKFSNPFPPPWISRTISRSISQQASTMLLGTARTTLARALSRIVATRSNKASSPAGGFTMADFLGARLSAGFFLAGMEWWVGLEKS